MTTDLFIKIVYNLKGNSFKVDTDIKKEKIKDILLDFISTQIGKGEDTSAPNKQDEYTISIGLNLNGDKFYCKHDCGNEGLMTGIVMNYLRQEKE